jgi:hypothetical protein
MSRSSIKDFAMFDEAGRTGRKPIASRPEGHATGVARLCALRKRGCCCIITLARFNNSATFSTVSNACPVKARRLSPACFARHVSRNGAVPGRSSSHADETVRGTPGKDLRGSARRERPASIAASLQVASGVEQVRSPVRATGRQKVLLHG